MGLVMPLFKRRVKQNVRKIVKARKPPSAWKRRLQVAGAAAGIGLAAVGVWGVQRHVSLQASHRASAVAASFHQDSIRAIRQYFPTLPQSAELSLHHVAQIAGVSPLQVVKAIVVPSDVQDPGLVIRYYAHRAEALKERSSEDTVRAWKALVEALSDKELNQLLASIRSNKKLREDIIRAERSTRDYD